MANRNQVIDGLEWVLEDDRFGFGTNWTENSKPKSDEERAGYNIQMAIVLLKELEPKEIVCKPGKRTNLDGSVDYFSEWYCPHCGRLLNRGFDTPWVKFCYRCGKPVTWE